MSGWDQYVNLVMHKLDDAGTGWATTNICTYACIYGQDGAKWASTEGFELHNYEFDLADEGGKITKVPCNEHANLLLAAGGNNKPSACGIRICNQKYMFQRVIDS